ncbi:N-acetyl-gamma-glutamyl-phosphate reductase [Effusibacillus lacus]|uniref:N-acetyl-gamma-glutamyl-phosphate reductase n=1 Tax=Effusibacillus lacus TaxID=1348429 RepID=A0A292YPL4_9BACL|nr:N-acetyl-gamma-glutamyl-phosphate reductase [Effusibacillus lacus]TCS74152.1 N-acetyl-gamma-glutamyl-phosphate reductase [Effusibacillus lacus]GAX90849.1 N-acetyl-gamma-glutamyl-phosphate reductase [Effusibacillus lacus]
MIRAAVVGASGYTGVELLRLLHRHPEVDIVCLTGDSSAGKRIQDIYPHLQGIYNQPVENTDPDLIAERADFVFIALPSGHTGSIVPNLLKKGLRVIDLGGDLRLPGDMYSKWYKKTPVPEPIQKQAVYGLSEWYRTEIEKAQLIANPGCYPTATLLALLPLVEAGAIEPDSIIVDAKSGVSGAGRAAALGSVFSEVNENFKAYKVNHHQHTPEIEQQLSKAAGKKVVMTFTPHLVPMTRGILATCYARVSAGWTQSRLFDLYHSTYEGKPFVRIRPVGNYPQTKEVTGSNRCDIGLSLDDRTGRLTVLSVIDNLVKGASGQAVQNLNIMAGFEETAGLDEVPLYP